MSHGPRRRVPRWLIAAGSVLALVAVAMFSCGGGGARPDVPWRVWGRVSAPSALTTGPVELPGDLFTKPDNATLDDLLPGFESVGYQRLRTPRQPAWRCGGFVLTRLALRERSIVDRILGRRPDVLAAYAPSGVERPVSDDWKLREYVRTFEEDEPWTGALDPAVEGAWDLVRGGDPAVRVDLASDGSVDGLGNGAKWASRDGVLVLRVPDARARTGVRHDTIVDHDGVWTGWGDDGAEIRMSRRDAR